MNGFFPISWTMFFLLSRSLCTHLAHGKIESLFFRSHERTMCEELAYGSICPLYIYIFTYAFHCWKCVRRCSAETECNARARGNSQRTMQRRQPQNLRLVNCVLRRNACIFSAPCMVPTACVEPSHKDMQSIRYLYAKMPIVCLLVRFGDQWRIDFAFVRRWSSCNNNIHNLFTCAAFRPEQGREGRGCDCVF